MEIDSCPLCLYVLQSKATLLLLLLLLSRYLFTSPSLYHAISKLLCCFVSMCLDGEFAVFLFALHCFALLWAKQSNARQDKAKQFASSVTANISHTNCHLVRYLLPTSHQSQRIAQSKAKQCKAKKKTAVGIEPNATREIRCDWWRRGQTALLCLALHCFALLKAKQHIVKQRGKLQ